MIYLFYVELDAMIKHLLRGTQIKSNPVDILSSVLERRYVYVCIIIDYVKFVTCTIQQDKLRETENAKLV